jgi:hypothetical protein
MKRVFLFLFVALSLYAQPKRSPHITVEELQHHVQYLASDELEGRRAGSKGADLAAAYIAREFESYGLTPYGTNGSFLQEFEFVAGVKLGPSNRFNVQSPQREEFMVDRDYRPLGFSRSGMYEGTVVFAGYGISLPNKTYDDYEGLDVKDKAVLVLRNAPPSHSVHEFAAQYSSLRYKANKAKELGAKLLIVVTSPEDDATDDLIRLSYDQSTGKAGIMAIHLRRSAADRLLRKSGTTVAALQKSLDTEKKPRSFLLKDVLVRIETEIVEIRQKTSNVIGYLEGNDPVLKNEVLVLGAHYDHLGWGGEGSGSLRPDTVAIHNGADDNASGTAGLLELAQAFAARRHQLKRSILFIAFAAEELGLLGSAHFVKSPTLPLERLVAMLNMDMIGRLNNRTLIVYGIGTSPGFEDLVRRQNRDSTFYLKLNKDGFGPSDHASFYGKQIPVFHFFTGIHGDYHRPSDDVDKLNYEGMRSIAEYIQAITLELNAAETKPTYVAVEVPRPPGGGGRGTRVYVGTIPDYGEQSEGMKISGVREGSPAAKAGLRGGDVIVKFGKVEVKNLYDFTYALGEYKPGDEVDVVVKRGSETLNMKVVLERRSQ